MQDESSSLNKRIEYIALVKMNFSTTLFVQDFMHSYLHPDP